jgi:hypothetical protein
VVRHEYTDNLVQHGAYRAADISGVTPTGAGAFVAHFRTTISTSLGVDAAFNYMADLRHLAEWDPSVARSVQVVGNGPGHGAEFDVDVRSPGVHLTLRYRTVLYQRPHIVRVEARSRCLVSIDTITVTTAVSPSGTLADVTYDAELHAGGVLRAMAPLIALSFRRTADRGAAGLRTVFDSMGAAP